MITIIADEVAKELGQEMYGRISSVRKDVRHFNLENMDIEPCYACRGCEEKANGRCVVRDDADLLLPCLSRSKVIIVLTPVVFGGYSFKVKRALDKLGLITSKHYSYYKGELRKGTPSGTKYYVIGINDNIGHEEISVFKKLVFETQRIVAWLGKAIVLPNDCDDYDNLMQEVLAL